LEQFPRQHLHLQSASHKIGQNILIDEIELQKIRGQISALDHLPLESPLDLRDTDDLVLHQQ
jgi:hypothetical protein